MSLAFCAHPGCLELAQADQPTCPDLLKFYCPQHEAAARARGETGKRKPYHKMKAKWQNHIPAPRRAVTRASCPPSLQSKISNLESVTPATQYFVLSTFQILIHQILHRNAMLPINRSAGGVT